MTTDHTQLRKLAEAAKASAAWYEHYRAYIEAVENPQAVIELLDEIERLKKDAARWQWWRKHEGAANRIWRNYWLNYHDVDCLDSAVDAAMLK